MIDVWEREARFLSERLLEMELGDELIFANGMTVKRNRGRFTVLDRGAAHDAFIGRSTADNVAEAANSVIDHLSSLRGEADRRLP